MLQAVHGQMYFLGALECGKSLIFGCILEVIKYYWGVPGIA